MSPSLESLPYEIKCSMLKCLPNFTTLLQFVIASRAFHDVYRDAKDQVVGAITDNFIPPGVYPDAYAAVRASQESSLSPGRQRESLDAINAWRDAAAREPVRTVTESDTFRRLVRLQNAVDDLTSDLCASVFDLARASNWTQSAQMGVRQVEVVRIQRALYRIDWLARARGAYWQSTEDVRDRLLLSMPPWEIDEMGCVYDYFMRRVARIVEACAEAHLEGEEEYYRLLFAEDTTPSRGTTHWAESYFTRGISTVNAIVQASKAPGSRKESMAVVWKLTSYERSNSPRAGLVQILILKPEPAELDNEFSISKGQGAAGPNAGWLWAHQEHDKTDWYQTWKADLGEWCASIWDDRRLDDWGRLKGEWSIDQYRRWAPMKREQNRLDRQRRMAQDPDKPRRIPCRHGLNPENIPPPRGFLYFRGSTEKGNHEFSTCPLCFDEISAIERTSGRRQVRVIRYGGQR